MIKRCHHNKETSKKANKKLSHEFLLRLQSGQFYKQIQKILKNKLPSWNSRENRENLKKHALPFFLKKTSKCKLYSTLEKEKFLFLGGIFKRNFFHKIHLYSKIAIFNNLLKSPARQATLTDKKILNRDATQTNFRCQETLPRFAVRIRKWTCKKYNTILNRDVNVNTQRLPANKNIFPIGHDRPTFTRKNLPYFSFVSKKSRFFKSEKMFFFINNISNFVY